MSVQEIIAQIKALEPEQRIEVQAEMLKLLTGSAPPEPRLSVDEAWQLLEHGWCDGGGRDIAGTIDEVLYGGEL